MKLNTIICDIDGTLMDISIRVANKKPFVTVAEDLEYYDTDTPKKPVVEVIKAFMDKGYFIQFMSGRTEIGREVTMNQIENALGIRYSTYSLLMRADGDYRPDSEVKSNMLDFIAPHTDVLFVLDDRDSVVKFWRSKGLTCFQVAEGNF